MRVWEGWKRTFEMHTRTRQYQRHVDDALRLVERALRGKLSPLISWSGGKDSTALTHLVRVKYGADIAVISEKDDLDYPGEEAYVRALAEEWNARVEIVRPPVSPLGWLLERRGVFSAGEDVHSRNAGLSKACFYGVMERAGEGHDVALWGLRAEESGPRRRLLTRKGPLYQLAAGTWRAHPLAFWTGLDVFAYLHAHEIEPLSVYKCCGWLPEHRTKPWLIRKSWWLPGAHAKNGAVAWLARYYPSLYAILKDVAPDARSYS